MSQNSIDDILVLNTRDDPDRSSATATDFDVDVEDALEPLCPGHCHMSLRRRADFRFGNRLDAFSTPGWGDQPAATMVRSEKAMVASEVDAWFGGQRCQACDEIHGIECHLCRSIPVRCLQGVDHLARGTQ
jgi:hypothetical protein